MEELNKQIQQHFQQNMQQHKLFRVSLSGRQVWDLYFNAFGDENNPVFRDPASSTHNCNHCKNFIRRYGNIVAIDDNLKVITLFDIKGNKEFKDSMKSMSKAISKSKISEIFLETFDELKSLPYESCNKNQEVFRLGVENNIKRYTKEEARTFGVVKEGEIRTFNHFCLDIPKKFVDMSGASIESIMANYRDAKQVFKRAMDEMSTDTLKLVRDLINQGSLLNGDSHLHKVETMIPLSKEYSDLAKKNRDNWCWVKSYGFQLAKFRNELMGVLCSDLSQGEDINKACKAWNKRVDPANYMKAKAPITKKQIKEAQKFVEENDFEASFDRRFAVADDIDINEILHINTADGVASKGSIFDKVSSTKKSSHSKNNFEDVKEIGIDKFMKEVLPAAEGLEVYLENKHSNNMMSLTTSNKADSKPIFKYSNNYSQTFVGNIAGKSEIRDAVVSQGGKTGDLRFSIMWAEGDDNSDLDAHCKLPNNRLIYFSSPNDRMTGGNLDIDITQPQHHKRSGNKVVENINFPSLNKMIDGTYLFRVNQYSARKSQGFSAEVEFNGEIFSYQYDKPLRGGINVNVAEVTLKDGKLSINHLLPETNSSRKIYNLDSKEFHKVNLMCLSPNHWGDNNVGDKHYLFLLDKCKANSSIRSFHNVDLIPELQKHRKVLEVLGTTNMIEPKDKNQLSGLGFNATVRDEVLVKVKGSHNRVLKIKF